MAAHFDIGSGGGGGGRGTWDGCLRQFDGCV